MQSDSITKAGRREWTGLAVIALPCMVYAMDLTVLNLALPALSAQLRPSSSQLLWIVDIYGFLVAGFLITMGTLGDRIGRRRLLLIGAGAFALASLLAAAANSAEMLIAMRAVLGIAGATLAPSTMSLIRNMFHDPHQRQFAIGIWIASFSLGAAIGPLVGGVLLQYFWWGSVFLPAVPVMLLLLALGPRLLPEYRDPGAGRLDLTSVAQSLLAVLASVYALKTMAENGVSWPPLVLLVGGLGVAWLFFRRQLRLAYPLLDLQLFVQPRFRAATVAYGLSSMAMFGVYIFIAQYLQLVLLLTPLQAGVATVPWALAFVVGSMGAPLLTSRSWGGPEKPGLEAPIRHRRAAGVLVWGMVLAAIGFALLALAPIRFGLSGLVVSTVVMGVGLGAVFTIGNEMIISAAPPERAGAASAIAETCSELSGALGIALMGSLGTVVYRRFLLAAMPTGIDNDALELALSTLGAALGSSAALPAALGSAVTAAAQAAFADAMQVAAAVGAALLLLAIVVAARILRGPASSQADVDQRSVARPADD